MNDTPGNSTKVTIERTYETSLDELWRMWTTKKGFGAWWAPEGFQLEVREIDPAVGGKLQYDMWAVEPDLIEYLKSMGIPLSKLERCRYSVYEPMQRLEIKMLIDFVPDVPPYESTIGVEMFADGKSVRQVLTLDPMHSPEFTAICAETLGRQLTNLGKQLKSVAS